MLLTKRPNHVMDLIPSHWRDGLPGNVWVGATVEDQEWAERRLPHLARIPAVVRFVSAEPLLGPIDLGLWAPSVDWIIMGGESGVERDLRKTDPEWYRGLRDQAQRWSIPLFLKQWGNWSEEGRKLPRKNTSHALDGHEWTEFPSALAEARRAVRHGRRYLLAREVMTA